MQASQSTWSLSPREIPLVPGLGGFGGPTYPANAIQCHQYRFNDDLIAGELP